MRYGGFKLGWLRAVTLALILAAGLVAVDGVAASSTAPRPDPPPVKKTPPPPPPPVRRAPPPPVYQEPPPPAYEAPPPPPVVSRPPPASGPTAAEILAAQRAVARAKAARRAARLKQQRREARRKRAEAARLAAAKLAADQREAAREARTQRFLTAHRGGGAGEAVSMAMPFAVAATVAALLLLALGFVPEYVVPRHRVSAVLDDHRGHFTLAAGMALLGSAVFFALNFFS